jgi:ATP-dependent DNA helicase RecQ
MNIHQVLKQYWGYEQFRPLQEEIITSVLAGNDTLALMPTGGGKSLCFQVPALAMGGLCVVVSPLIALMQDQVFQLRKRGISAIGVFSGMSYQQIDIALDNCAYGDVRFLYLSPERLKTPLLQERIKKMPVRLLAIDEAHCISQWGYDFRPPYLEIAEFRKLLPPNTPVIALTATATREVRQDIIEKLAMESPQVFQKSFARENLSYSAFQEEDKDRRLINILSNVQGSSVVYVRNRRRTQEIAEMLVKYGISAAFYHAGLNTDERAKRQNAWIENKTRVMVATNAFGMGIDKPDVRTVVHIDLPDTLEAYYQEAGRAGRDGQKAFAVALFNKRDIENLEQNINQNFPPIEIIKQVYQALGNHCQVAIGAGELASYDFELLTFQKTYQLPSVETFFALKKLEDAGFIQISEALKIPARIQILMDNRQLYDFQLRNSKFEAFLKLLLRMYGGLIYTEFRAISEAEIAKYYKAPLPEVERTLDQLAKLQVLAYEPQKDKPQITFLTPRHDAKALPFDVAAMDRRKQLLLGKARAVIAYMKHPHRCRTQMLLEYFDEHTDQRCEVCDHCLAQKKTERSKHKTQEIKDKILALLANGAMTTDLLTKIMLPTSAKDTLDLIREMLGDELLKHDDAGRVKLNR